MRKKFLFFIQKKVSGTSHSAKNPDDGTLWDFLTSILLRTIKTIDGGPFGDFEKISKKSNKAEITSEL